MTLQEAQDKYNALSDEIEVFQEKYNCDYTPAQQRELAAMRAELDRLYLFSERKSPHTIAIIPHAK